MSKVNIFCLVRKRVISVDKRLADALVKMKRASYDTTVASGYQTKVMIADTTEASEFSGSKRRGRKAKVVDEKAADVDDVKDVEQPEEAADVDDVKEAADVEGVEENAEPENDEQSEKDAFIEQLNGFYVPK